MFNGPCAFETENKSRSIEITEMTGESDLIKAYVNHGNQMALEYLLSRYRERVFN